MNVSPSTLRRLGAQLGGLLFTLVAASVVIFAALAAAPGDPVGTIIGGARPTPELVADVRAEYRLDDPFWVQYWHWLTDIVSGELGQSFVYKSDISAIVGPRLGVTLQLVAFSALLVLVFGVGSGILAALNRKADRAVLVATSIGIALPTFIVAILLIWIFGRTLGLFPVLGAGEGGLDRIRHLTMPAASLSVIFIAYTSRVTRGAIVAQLGTEHLETARVRGIPAMATFRKHVLLNASPQLFAISGPTIAGLFAASAIAERAFGIGGLGSLLIEAAARKDLPVVQVIALMMVTIFVVANALGDLAVALVDPRTAQRRP